MTNNTESGWELELGKLLVMLVIIIGVVVLMITEHIDSTFGAGLLGTALGYTVGNGRLAAKGSPTVPMIGRRALPPPPPEEPQ